MKVYLDVSCLNRPFDDKGQLRIRLEAEAVSLIVEQCNLGVWEHVSSEMAMLEIDAIRDVERRDRVRQLLPVVTAILLIKPPELARATLLERLGFQRADALHVAAAEAQVADVLLSCDDRLCRLTHRRRSIIKVRVLNPLDWLEEIGHGPNT